MSDSQVRVAPGAPGILPRWTSSAKTGVGTARNLHSQVWFTLSHGILDEIYFPRVDQACTRDQGLLVSDGSGFFSEEKRNTTSRISALAPGVPGYRLINTCSQGRYRIVKEVISDPFRNSVLQKISCWLPISRTSAREMMPGWETTRASLCSSRSETVTRWPSRARFPGRACR